MYSIYKLSQPHTAPFVMYWLSFSKSPIRAPQLVLKGSGTKCLLERADPLTRTDSLDHVVAVALTPLTKHQSGRNQNALQ